MGYGADAGKRKTEIMAVCDESAAYGCCSHCRGTEGFSGRRSRCGSYAEETESVHGTDGSDDVSGNDKDVKTAWSFFKVEDQVVKQQLEDCNGKKFR